MELRRFSESSGAKHYIRVRLMDSYLSERSNKDAWVGIVELRHDTLKYKVSMSGQWGMVRCKEVLRVCKRWRSGKLLGAYCLGLAKHVVGCAKGRRVCMRIWLENEWRVGRTIGEQ